MIEVPEYQKVHGFAEETTQKILVKYAHMVRWPKINANVVDVGCGEGKTTVAVLKELIDKHVPEYNILGIDLCENMLTEAKRKYGKEQYQNVDFKQLDVGRECIEESMKNRFDIAFSIYCLHWIPNHNWAKNIYNMLKADSQVFFIVILSNPLIDAFRKAGKNEKWLQYEENKIVVNDFFKSGNPEFWLTPLLRDAGFKHIFYGYDDYNMHCDKEHFQNLVKTFPALYAEIPDDMKEEYTHEVIQIFVERNAANEFNILLPHLTIIADK